MLHIDLGIISKSMHGKCVGFMSYLFYTSLGYVIFHDFCDTLMHIMRYVLQLNYRTRESKNFVSI